MTHRFVAFVYTADERRKTAFDDVDAKYQNAAQTGIAFSFFSMLAWVCRVGLLIVN